ncbi:hypothetical protein TEQG_05006 [Trichophyton equinum CBS 127.97]|uniref:Uncharacterized protein n=1 Tax=Trichophyton equinum (strain ATCC MYA-4606 / CBS 127.97) TaxID=559882 RepID=F2PVT1_TRIEC|nr:hypothetical protein TEQG_05006 [Trichophyton equinum CBS 127.97]
MRAEQERRTGTDRHNRSKKVLRCFAGLARGFVSSASIRWSDLALGAVLNQGHSFSSLREACQRRKGCWLLCFFNALAGIVELAAGAAGAALAAAVVAGTEYIRFMATTPDFWLLVDGCWLLDLLCWPGLRCDIPTFNLVCGTRVWAQSDDYVFTSATGSRCIPLLTHHPHVMGMRALAWLALLHRPGYVDDTSSSPLSPSTTPLKSA